MFFYRRFVRLFCILGVSGLVRFGSLFVFVNKGLLAYGYVRVFCGCFFVIMVELVGYSRVKYFIFWV